MEELGTKGVKEWAPSCDGFDGAETSSIDPKVTTEPVYQEREDETSMTS